MDYTKFLSKTERLVLAYLGGPAVVSETRRLRVAEPRPAPGVHVFEVKGREARALGSASDAPDELAVAELLARLPKARGHATASGFVVLAGERGKQALARVQLPPSDEPPALSVVRLRRWHSGDLLFEALDFDGDAELAARERLEDGAPLGDVPGVAASLRVAFGIALAMRVARFAGLSLSAREASAFASEVADLGADAARSHLGRLEAARRAEAARLEGAVRHATQLAARDAAIQRRAAVRDGRLTVTPTVDNAPARAEAALDAADARLLACRRLQDGQVLEVRFEFLGERFVSLVDALTLQVHDAGVCLAGEDQLVTLDSLPGVLREAIDEGALVVTRH